MPVVGVAEVLIRPSFGGFQKELGDAVDETVPAAGKKAGTKLGDRMNRALGKAVKVGALAAGVAAGAALVGGFKSAVDQQTSKKVLTGLYGSVKEAEDMMKSLRDVAKKSPIEYSTYLKAAESLAYSGVEGEKAAKTLENVGKAISAAGGSSEDMDRATDSVMKMVNAGKVSLDSLQQLSGSGVPIISGLAEHFGVSMEEINTMASKGKIGLEDVTSVMEKGTGKTFQTMIKAGEEASQSFGNQMTIAKDNVVTALGTTMMPLLDRLAPMIAGVGDAVTRAIENIPGLVEKITPFFKMLWDNRTVIGVLVSGMAAYLAITKTLAAFTAIKTWLAGTTLAQKGLNAAMRANPIGFLITLITLLVGTLVWLYQNNETARRIMDAAWAGIKNAVKFAWEKVIKPAFQAISSFVKNVLGPIFVWLYQNIVKPVWKAIKTAIAVAIAAVIVTFNLIKWTIENGLAPVFRWLYNKVIKPVWGYIKAVINTQWVAIKAIFNAIKWFLENVLSPAFSWFYNKVIKPVWGGIKRTISSIWNNGIKPIFKALGSFIEEKVAPVFKKGVDKIKNIWDSIKKFAKKPIKFVVDTVINKGLIGAFNKVAGWIPGVDKLDPVKIPGFARGGWTGAGSKYQEAGVVHADEFVIRKESQRDLARKAPGLLDGLNRMGSRALGYASGGLVRRPVGGRVTSGFGAGRGRYPHAGIDFAVPIGTAVRAALDGVVKKAGRNVVAGRTGLGMLVGHPGGRDTYYGHLSGFVKKVGDQVKQGMQIARSGNTGNSTGPHLHFETWSGGKPLNPARFLGGDVLPQGAEGGGGFDPMSVFSGLKDRLLQKFTDKFPGGAHMIDIAKGVGGKLIGDVKDWALDKLGSITDFGGNLLSRGKNALGLGNTKDQVRGVAGGYGWAKGAQWKALSNIISRESGWDVNAANPNSSARGLFQKMTSIHGAIEKTAGDQAGWGLNYIKGRYGDPVRAWDYWQRNHHYADGGQVAPYLHDKGGVLNPGLSQIVNKTRKPEAILTGRQWSDIHNLAVSGSNGGTFVGDLYLDSGEFMGKVQGVTRQELAGVARATAGRRR